MLLLGLFFHESGSSQVTPVVDGRSKPPQYGGHEVDYGYQCLHPTIVDENQSDVIHSSFCAGGFCFSSFLKSVYGLIKVTW